MGTPPDPYWSALRTELDDIAQSMFGIIAALIGHQRRAHKASSRSFVELNMPIGQLTALQHRLAQAVHSREIS
jgi:hypothetical protein